MIPNEYQPPRKLMPSSAGRRLRANAAQAPHTNSSSAPMIALCPPASAVILFQRFRLLLTSGYEKFLNLTKVLLAGALQGLWLVVVPSGGFARKPHLIDHALVGNAARVVSIGGFGQAKNDGSRGDDLNLRVDSTSSSP
ncbi:hypothetical protein NLG97_g11241 [Lecanicillium saksenae]|uniref:Uncharacterized protein n=1 Tax=Lecanicillium saksenae TaxID=468837 RepID=A0ACC1QE35_9HYPO|nr:hypothetical protein NLG97_g11241 [Lecanicillium saksenae]